MEGRSQTLDYVRTPHRFELTLPDPSVIGQRRAARDEKLRVDAFVRGRCRQRQL